MTQSGGAITLFLSNYNFQKNGRATALPAPPPPPPRSLRTYNYTNYVDYYLNVHYLTYEIYECSICMFVLGYYIYSIVSIPCCSEYRRTFFTALFLSMFSSTTFPVKTLSKLAVLSILKMSFGKNIEGSLFRPQPSCKKILMKKKCI